MRVAGGALEVAVASAEGRTGHAASLDEPGVAEAITRLAGEWRGMPLLAAEQRWQRWGRTAMANRVERLAYGALDLACADLACACLNIPLAALAGGWTNATSSRHALAGDMIDGDETQDLALLARAALRSDATMLAVSLHASGGLTGLRRFVALARALNLQVQLQAQTGAAIERKQAVALAAAFGLDLVDAASVAVEERPSRVRRVRLRRVTLPLAQVYVSAMYLTDRVQRTIIEVETDDGLVGLGETGGNDDTFQLAVRLAKGLVGRDALDRRGLLRHFANVSYENRNGRSGWQALGGLELACWDLTARRCGVPLADLLGRADAASSVRAVCLLPAAKLDRLVARSELADHFADVGNARRVVEHALAQRAQHGFGCFKYKSAGLSPAWDLAVLRGLREALGAHAELRFDPNAAYGTATAAALCRELEPLALEYYEDPTDGIEGLARLRAGLSRPGLSRPGLSRPIASNMMLIQFDHFAPAVRRGAIDVLLADLFHWGGVENFRDMAAAAEVFGLDAAIHSFYESGVATTANVHLALGLGLTRHANDQGHNDLAADVLAPDAVRISDGHMALPRGPGIGVTLDESRMRSLTSDDVVVDA